MEKKRRTEIAELGEFGLIDLLTRGFDSADASTLRAAGDDAAIVMPPSGEAVLCSTDALLEGIDFDLTYFPLRHLGYKAVTVAASDILAMNALPSQLMVSLGVSSKMSVEALQDLYEGIAFACREQGIDLVGGDTKASMTGLVLGLTALGHAPKEKVVSRGGAQQNDLICISGNLGAAYMGLRLLEREKRVLADVKDPEPKFAGYEYLLEKYLKPASAKGHRGGIGRGGHRTDVDDRSFGRAFQRPDADLQGVEMRGPHIPRPDSYRKADPMPWPKR